MTNPLKGTSLWESGLIWFGAALSIAEMQIGIYFAPLGIEQGMVAILLGHLIGCGLLFAAGAIGGLTQKSAMETVKMSFGANGGRIFALLNMVQLLGWTGIMIYEGALAANSLFSAGHSFWCCFLGVLIIVWIALGLKNLGKLNAIAMGSLLLSTLLLSTFLWGNVPTSPQQGKDISLALALELSMLLCIVVNRAHRYYKYWGIQAMY